ncbi:MAG TPA: hypothetical protein VJ187_03290 [Nitrospirota bacterium]|nr:hypothetical protein [Nitrospirota bacterium]
MKRSNNALFAAGFILCFFTFMTACAPRIIPRADQPGFVDAEDNIITKEKAGIRVSVRTEEWRYTPYAVNDYFTPFLFLIRNNTRDKVVIKYSGLILFDEHGNQFEAVPPEGVEYMMASRDVYGERNTDLFFRAEETRPPYTYGSEVPAYLRRPFSNISILSLPEAPIYPNSQVRGFVYFRKAITYGKTLRLKVELGGFEEEFEFDIKK